MPGTGTGTLTLEDLVSLGDFQQLLTDKEFIDFFNKFICLPAFSQLVQIQKKDSQFLLYPALPDSYTVNKKGLVEWLWRKRLTFFIKSKFFSEYRLCITLIHHSFLRQRAESSQTKHIDACLKWLQRRSLGRVSKLRQFQRFLRHCEDGLKLYYYWLDAERLYFHIKLRSSATIEVFKSMKDKYFISENETKMPQHLLDEALECLPPYHQNKGIATDAVCYDVTFAMCLQRICINRLQGYWLPRFLLEQACLAKREEEYEMLETAWKYLRGTLDAELQKQNPSLGSAEAKVESSSCSNNQYSDEVEGCKNGRNGNGCSHHPRKRRGEKSCSKIPGSITDVTEQKPKDQHRRKVFIKDSARPLDTSNSERSAKNNEAGKTKDTSSSEDEEESKRRIRRERRARRKLRSRERTRSTSDCESEQRNSMEDSNTRVEIIEKHGRGQKIDSKRDRRIMAMRIRKMKHENLFAEPDSCSTTPTPVEKMKQIYKAIDDNRGHLFEEYDKELTRSPFSRTNLAKSEGTETNKSSSKSIRFAIAQKLTMKQPSALTVQINSAEENHDAHRNSIDVSEEEFYQKLLGKPCAMSSLDNLSMSKRNPLSLKHEKSSRQMSISPPRLNDVLAQSNFKRRKSNVKAKPKKPATNVQTKMTFSLSGGKPVPPTPQEKSATRSAANDRKSLRQEKVKKLPQRSEKRHFLPEISPAPTITMTEYTLEQDNAYRRHPDHARMILAFQSDQCASQPFRTFLVATDNTDLICSLNFWQDVEKSRQDFQYGTMSFQNFVQSMQKIVRTYLAQNSPYRIDAPLGLREQAIKNCVAPEMREMPWQMRELQKEAMDDLKLAYLEFADHETRSFFNAAAFKKTETVPQTTSSGLFPPITGANGNAPFDVADCAGQEIERNDIAAQMIARMMRSLDFLIETSLPDGRDVVTPTKNMVESDEEDNVALPEAPRYIVDPPVNYKELAAHSVKEYPVHWSIGKPLNAPRKASRRQTTVGETPKKVRASIERPVYRPKTFEEVLRDDAHLHFFNRYLKAYRADIPLRFWNAVERMSRIEKNKVKHIQARKIADKYFHNKKTPATTLLQTNSDIIKDIAKREIIPTNRLFMAQVVVEKELEERWFHKYANTFLDIPVHSSRYDVHNHNDGTTMYRNQRLKGIWSVIRVFIKRAGSFLRNMRKPHMFELFEKFLQREMEDRASPSKSEGQMDAFENRSDSTLSPVLCLRRDWDAKVKQRLIHGRLITFNFLTNDLHFWRDVEYFRKLVNDFSTESELSPDATREDTLLRSKAKLIVSCYLESDILPRVRVNVPTEIAKFAAESLKNGVIEYGMFHEATIMIFPVLLDFWRKFCTEHYTYIPTLSKKHQKIYGYKMTPAIAEKRKSTKKADVPSEEGGDIKRSVARVTSSSKYLHMDQAHFTTKNPSPIGLEDMGLRLTFSLRQGVTLIQPSLKKGFTAENSMRLVINYRHEMVPILLRLAIRKMCVGKGTLTNEGD